MGLVLVIDDDPATMFVIQAILRRAGFEVLSASSHGTAAQFVSEHNVQPSLVISDVVLAEPGAVSVAAGLKECLPAPILLTSGSPLDILVERGFLTGADLVPGQCEFLPKPFTAITLLEAVYRLLRNADAAKG